MIIRTRQPRPRLIPFLYTARVSYNYAVRSASRVPGIQEAPNSRKVLSTLTSSSPRRWASISQLRGVSALPLSARYPYLGDVFLHHELNRISPPASRLSAIIMPGEQSDADHVLGSRPEDSTHVQQVLTLETLRNTLLLRSATPQSRRRALSYARRGPRRYCPGYAGSLSCTPALSSCGGLTDVEGNHTAALSVEASSPQVTS